MKKNSGLKIRRKQRLNAEFEVFFTLSFDLICIFDTKGTLLKVNFEMEKTLGLSSGGLVGGQFLDFVKPEDKTKTRKAIANLERGEEVGGLVNRCLCRDNAFRYMEWRLRLIGEGLVFAAARDISAQKTAAAALRASERNYREIFDSTSEAIFIHDAGSGRILDVNEAMLKMYGYSRKKDVMAGNIGDLSASDNSFSEESAQEVIARTLQEGPQTFEWLAKRKDGQCFWTEISMKKTEIGGQGRILAVVRDISERKKASEERERLQASLIQVQKMESIGRLAGGVAHDFNNMLQVILGYTDLALSKSQLDDIIHDYLLEIKAAARHSAELTSQLLAFARRQSVNTKILQLNEILAGMLNMLQRLIGEEIELLFKPGADLWLVKVDPFQVEQILANLLVNSRDAISGHGKVTIETGNVVFAEDTCRPDKEFFQGDFVLLTVSDTGSGFTREALEHLFEPFFTTKQVGRGTGLGLAMVYGIVKQNKGWINVESNPGQGSRIKIYLPRQMLLSEKEVEQTTVQNDIDEYSGLGTVLMVEDEEAILDLGRDVLESYGYKVLVAATPMEGLDLAQNYAGKIDLLITDVIMPGMNGLELQKKIQLIRPTVRVLFISGYPIEVMAQRGILESGVNFLPKPFTVKSFAAKVAEILRRS